MVSFLPSQSFALQMPALPKGEPRSQCELHLCRIRLTFAQTCHRAAPSVTACAVPPSSERKAFVSHDLTCLSLWERCRAATERAGSLPLTYKPNLSLPLGEMSRSDREGRLTTSYAQTKLVSPSGRDVAQRQRGLISAGMVFEGLP